MLVCATQMKRLRADQEAALVDLRVSMMAEFRSKELEWTRDRASLSTKVTYLESVRTGTSQAVCCCGDCGLT